MNLIQYNGKLKIVIFLNRFFLFHRFYIKNSVKFYLSILNKIHSRLISKYLLTDGNYHQNIY